MALLPFGLGSASIASLLLYFYGITSMGTATRWLLTPALLILVTFVLWARRRRPRLAERVLAGLWAGALATFAYDVVRVPISMAGVPVFKAISYFGTLILRQAHPTLASEIVGWGYHLSNGLGFAVMYAMLVRRPRLWSALLWGVTLEVAMLMTPYAEVFGYRLSAKFLAITIGAHLVYGAVLWAGLRAWNGQGRAGAPWAGTRRAAAFSTAAVVALLGIGGVAWEFHAHHAASIPPSPPSYVGEHLYTTWNVLEPDRVVLLWLVRRFEDPEAHFHFVEPFSHSGFGRWLDTPEAEIRRGGSRSASELFIEDRGLGGDARLELLAKMTHLFEISRWQLPSHPEAYELGQRLMDEVGECETLNVEECSDRGFRFLDAWYGEP